MRTPSLSVIDQRFNGLRRRSGGYAKHDGGTVNPDSTPRIPRSPDSQMADDMVEISGPTVLLVSRSQESSSHPRIHVGDASSDDFLVDNVLVHAPTFCPVPLTPRPDPPSQHGSDASVISGRSEPPARLPTPDFTQPMNRNGPGSLPGSMLQRGLCFVASRTSAASSKLWSSTTGDSGHGNRPNSVRTDSVSSAQSSSSSCSTSSVDSGHSCLIPALGTTDKFTHKWPRPLGLRTAGIRGGGGGGMDSTPGVALRKAAGEALEEGLGLGMNPVARWTVFKWCLLLSVLTVFAYGCTGLVCAILIWFRGAVPYWPSCSCEANPDHIIPF